MKKVSFRLSLLLVAIAFIAAACGSSAATSASSPASTSQATQTMTMMHLPAYAQNMKTLIALLTDNGHAPLNPPVASEVMVMIG